MKNEKTQWFAHDGSDSVFVSTSPDIQLGDVICEITFADGSPRTGTIKGDLEIAQLIARAPELLKENEQHLAEIKRLNEWIADEQGAKERERAINAELLEALKFSLEALEKLVPSVVERDSKVFGFIKQRIAKAEGKTLVVS